MSINIDWSKLLEDEEGIETKLRDFLDEQFQHMHLPPFIQSLSVSSLKLGTVAPDITIRHISDPFPEFYEDSSQDEGEAPQANHESFSSAPEFESADTNSSVPSELDLEHFSLNNSSENYGADQDQTLENMYFSTPRMNGSNPPLPDESTFGADTEDEHDPPSGIMSPNGPLSRPFGRTSTVNGVLNYSRFGRGLSPPPVTSPHYIRPPHTPPVYESTRLGPEIANALGENLATGLAQGLSGGLFDEQEAANEASDKSPFDLQTFVEIKYKGDMQLGVTATLLINYPSPNFVSLPLEFQVRGFEIHSLAVIGFLQSRVHISILCDIDSNDQMLSENVKVIKSMKMESKIGDSSHHGAVLRNVGRVERFILEQLRKVIRDELVWPGWITLEL